MTLFEEKSISYYEVDQNSDSTEGRGAQIVQWRGASLQQAKQEWRKARGVYGTDQQKYIYLKTVAITSDGAVKESRVTIYGSDWNWETHRPELKWRGGFTGNEA